LSTECSSLRGYLAYLHRRGAVALDLSRVVVSPRVYQHDRCPRFLTRPQIDAVLAPDDLSTRLRWSVRIGLTVLAFVALITGIWGPDAKTFVVPSWLHETTDVAGAHIPNDRWIEIATAAVVLALLQLFLRRTRYGLIIRAGVENRAMVQALGIDVRKAFTIVFAVFAARAQAFRQVLCRLRRS
jgi:hypothetical protein